MSKWSFDPQKFVQKLETLAESPPLSVGFVDIDDFKFINDTYGHAAGDRVLQMIKAVFTKEPLTLHRVGGDAFVAVMERTSPEEALLQLDGARRRISAHGIKSGSKKIPVDISIGIASFPQHVEDVGLLQGAAEEALERAKRDGKGRVAIYVEDKMVLKSNYYTRGQLSRLATIAERLERTEASLLRESLNDVLEKYRDAS